jgi:hypothetical protein
MATTCNGRSITCPAPIPVPDGTPCSLNPPGLTTRMSTLDPMPYLYRSKAAAAVQAATVTTAAAQGLEQTECQRCYQGKCTRIFVLKQGQRTAGNPQNGRESVDVRRGREGVPPVGAQPSGGLSGVGRVLQAYSSKIKQPAWMYCK